MSSRLAWLVLSLLVVAVSCTPQVEDKSLSRITEAGKIAIGIDPSYPPFESIDGRGQLVGFDVDVAEYIARQLGVRADFIGVDIGGIQDGLVANQYDAIISSLPPFPEYTKSIAYSRPYFNAGQVLVVNSNKTGQAGSPSDGTSAGLADLNGKTLGVEAASEADVDMRKLVTGTLAINIRPYSTVDDLVPALKGHQIDAAAMDAVTAFEFAKNNRDITVKDQPLTVEPYVIATRKGDALLLNAIDAALDKMENDGTGARLRQKWLGNG